MVSCFIILLGHEHLVEYFSSVVNPIQLWHFHNWERIFNKSDYCHTCRFVILYCLNFSVKLVDICKSYARKQMGCNLVII